MADGRNLLGIFNDPVFRLGQVAQQSPDGRRVVVDGRGFLHGFRLFVAGEEFVAHDRVVHADALDLPACQRLFSVHVDELVLDG